MPTGLMTTHRAARPVGRGPEADLVLRTNDQFTRREHGTAYDAALSLLELYRPFAVDQDIFTPEAVSDGEVVTARNLIKKFAVECPANIAVQPAMAGQSGLPAEVLSIPEIPSLLSVERKISPVLQLFREFLILSGLLLVNDSDLLPCPAGAEMGQKRDVGKVGRQIE